MKGMTTKARKFRKGMIKKLKKKGNLKKDLEIQEIEAI